MEHIALYRKYRPHTFKNLVGQDYIKNTLVNAVKSGNTSHAYLFCGPRGTGKTTAARLIAKALNCENLTDGHEPCNECQFCNAINEGSLIDVIEIDAASNRGIDEIRDLKEKIQFSPSRSKCKIYIVDEVHMMTKEAFNALLKTLEEPPSYVYFILATTEVHKIPETIISRCQRFDFKRIDEKALMTRLSYIAQLEGIEAEDKAVEAISRHVEGGLRDAIQLLEQLTYNGKLTFEHVQDILGVSDFETLDKLFDAIMQNDSDKALKVTQDIHSQGYDLNQFCHDFIAALRQKLLSAVNENNETFIARYLELIEIFQKAKEQLKTYTIQILPLEIAVISSTKDLVAQISPSVILRDEPELKKETVQIEQIVSQTKSPEQKNESPNIVQQEKVDIANVDAIPLTFNNVKDHWPRITERINIPACKRSLMDAEVSNVEGIEVTMEFTSNFHRNKVMEHDNRVEIEKIFKELFGQEVKLASKVKDIKLGSIVNRDVDERAKERPVAGLDKEDDLADQAMEIFGGELMEEEN